MNEEASDGENSAHGQLPEPSPHKAGPAAMLSCNLISGHPVTKVIRTVCEFFLNPRCIIA